MTRAIKNYHIRLRNRDGLDTYEVRRRLSDQSTQTVLETASAKFAHEACDRFNAKLQEEARS